MMRLAVLVFFFALAHGNSSTTVVKPSSSTLLPSISSSSKASHSSPTASHSSTVNKTSVTKTPAVTTRAVANKTSTTKIVSVSITPSNTTVIPVMNSTVHPTTAPPTTAPPPDYGEYDVTNEKGSYCLLAQMKATLQVTYMGYHMVVVNKTTNKTEREMEKQTVKLQIPIHAANFTLNGSICGKQKAVLDITWPPKKKFYKLSIEFKSGSTVGYSAKSSNGSWGISMVSVHIVTTDNEQFKNATAPNFSVKTNHSDVNGLKLSEGYRCDSLEFKDLKDTTSNSSVDLVIDEVKFQPFMVKSKNFTENLQECAKDKPTPKPKSDDNIVPIAVGCALAGLVLIVLIAYIIGRRKSQRGYEKV